jgi:hypothetical protein
MDACIGQAQRSKLGIHWCFSPNAVDSIVCRLVQIELAMIDILEKQSSVRGDEEV